MNGVVIILWMFLVTCLIPLIWVFAIPFFKDICPKAPKITEIVSIIIATILTFSYIYCANEYEYNPHPSGE